MLTPEEYQAWLDGEGQVGTTGDGTTGTTGTTGDGTTTDPGSDTGATTGDGGWTQQTGAGRSSCASTSASR